VSWMGRVVQKLPYRTRRSMERYRHAALVVRGLAGVHPRTCTICGYTGRFRAFGLPPTFDVQCPACDSLDRHRLFVLVDHKHNLLNGVRSLLHFAPEPILQVRFQKSVAEYLTADLLRGDVDHRCNIEDTGLPDARFDAVFASHILEHVDDRKALSELHRILTPAGKLIAMVPIIEGWDDTYEDPTITAPEARALHFGQADHIRYYGRDFTARLSDAGFEVRALSATPQECIAHGLRRGHKVFVATKPGASFAE
jgi:SAM-dependent methyltransferase